MHFDTDKPAAWTPTRIQFLHRHQNERYYVRTFAAGKEKRTSLKTTLLSVAKNRMVEDWLRRFKANAKPHVPRGATSAARNSSRSDILNPGTMRDGKSLALSVEESVGLNPETGQTAVGEMLAGAREDPASVAARDIGWSEFLGQHDDRYTASGAVRGCGPASEQPEAQAAAQRFNVEHVQAPPRRSYP